ncbi:MAG: hypothetical protein AAGJ29_09455 [Pseudomonadota bacterium]
MAGLLLIGLIALLGLRSFAIVSTDHRGPGPETTPYGVLAEAIVGAGNARAIDTGTGNIVVLIDASAGALGSEQRERLADLFEAVTPDRAVLIQSVDTIGLSTPHITLAERLEIAALLIAAGLCAWILLSLSGKVTVVRMPIHTPNPTVRAETAPPSPSRPSGIALQRAVRFAKSEPEKTAAVIRSWMNDLSQSA